MERKRERKREWVIKREREGDRDRDREREMMEALKGRTGALAPFSYLVINSIQCL